MRANSAVLRFGLGVGLIALASSSALAQLTGGDPNNPQPQPDTEVPPNVQPEPTQPVQTQIQTQTTVTTTTGEGGEKGSKTTDSAVDGRPSVFAFGIGFGWAFPTDLQAPNTTSVRVRLPTGLTFEPTATLGMERDSPDDDTTNTVTTLQLGTLVRIPVWNNYKFDFEGLVGAQVGTVMTNPEGDDNDSSVTSFGVNWGLAVSYWVTPHWNLSMSAYTPFLSYQKSSDDNGDGPSQTNIGVIWDPTVVAMIHLYH